MTNIDYSDEKLFKFLFHFKYEYDSWGNIISITDGNGIDISTDNNHVANINPFRYRSYYYDKEINLYYLNSRYYSPEWGRFINADCETYSDTLGNNIYVYCSNNPISRLDINGHSWWPIACMVVGMIWGGVSQIISNKLSSDNKKWYDGLLGALAGGAISGLFTSSNISLPISSYIGSLAESLINNSLEQLNSDTKMTRSEFAATIMLETGINGTIDLTLGKFVDDVIPNVRGAKPKKILTSIKGKHAINNYQKSSLQTGYNIVKNKIIPNIEINTPNSSVTEEKKYNRIGITSPMFDKYKIKKYGF